MAYCNLCNTNIPFELIATQTSQWRQLVDRVKADYTATAKGTHHSSKLRLLEMGRGSDEALAAAVARRMGG